MCRERKHTKYTHGHIGFCKHTDEKCRGISTIHDLDMEIGNLDSSRMFWFFPNTEINYLIGIATDVLR